MLAKGHNFRKYYSRVQKKQPEAALFLEYVLI